MDMHTYHTCVSDVLSFLFRCRVGSGWRKTCLKKTEYRWKTTPRRNRVAYTCTNIDKYNNRLGVDMNTEHFLIIPDKAVHDVENQATQVWRDHSFRWIQSRCSSMTMTHASDRTATPWRRWCSHPPTLSRRCHTAAACMLHEVPGLILVDLEKYISEQKVKNTGAKYAVTISGGRQRHNASTRASLSGANVLQQQAAARSSNTL